MDKVNRAQSAQILVFATCLMFIIPYFAPAGTFLSAQQPKENDWVAYPQHITNLFSSSNPQGYSPSQIRTAYNLPSQGGNGTTIAIIDAFDTPDILSYFNTFSHQFGLPDNSTGNLLVHKMAATMQTDSEWSSESALDVEWTHAIAPNATILLVEARSDYGSDLRSAIAYATSQLGVVAVSMSWGTPEFSSENSTNYENYFNKPGIAFFASSGDDGSSVLWPAASASVIAVGGTTLSLNSDGTVISEVAWSNSSGGLSAYVPQPPYQANFGLPYINRAVPDVSYDGNASTGVATYDGSWWKMGGTSAGAPQWAAIYALGFSATNANLYQRAKSAYSSYFKDIVAGSSYVYNASSGYDLVTGLGSPLTFKFGTSLEVSPTSGPAGGPIIFNGLGFPIKSAVNISYLNPLTSSWIPLADNLTTESGNLSFSAKAPDLARNSMAGDSPAAFDTIVFRAQDNITGLAYNTTLPYTEWRRGIAQVAGATAQGLLGNSTDLSTTVFVQNSQSITVSGNWFSPGTASFMWDDFIALGTALVDGTGFFNASVQVPTSSAGQHRLTVNDGSSIFCVNLTRLPTVANDYMDGWHTSNMAVNLTPDYAVNETFYSLNGGPIYKVTLNGQPTITTESGSNTLEYWSIWDVYGAGLTDLPHVTVTGIKLDKTPPVGSITTGATTETSKVNLVVSATDAVSGVSQMRFSNDNATWSDWEPYTTSKTWSLQGDEGQKIVFAQFLDNAGLTSTGASYALTLQTPQPTVVPMSMTSPTATPAPTPTPSPTTAPTTPTASPSPTISPTLSVPEIPTIAAILGMLVTLILVVTITRRRK